MTSLLPIALGLLFQSTTLLLLGLIMLRLTRHRGAALQSLVGRATLAGVALALILVVPLTGHIRPLWHVTMPVESSIAKEPTPLQVVTEPTPTHSSPPPPKRERGEFKPGHSSMAQGGAAYGEGATSSAPTSRILTSSPSRSGRAAPRFYWGGGGVGLPYSLVAAAWALGTAALLLWLGICQWHLTRLRRQACPVTSGPAAEMIAALTPRPPTLLAHPSVRSPFLSGLRHQAIFLPTTYEADFDATALRAILAHELAHRTRRDTAWTLAARLLCALLWPQPLLWLLCHRLEQLGEEACDQAVLAQDCPPRAYADCLLTLAERHPLGRRERALGAGVAPFRSSLGRRIGRILDKGTSPMPTVTPRLRLTIAALAVAAVLGGMFLVSSAPAQTSHFTPSKGTPLQGAVVPRFLYSVPDAANLADLDARIMSARSHQQRAMHELADFQRAAINAPPGHQVRLARLSQNYELADAILKQLVRARVEFASAPRSAPRRTKPTSNQVSMSLTDLHCYMNMKQVALAIWGYTYHHNDRFPDADRWMDEIKPYLKSEGYYHDPAAPASERYSYAYNRNLSGAAADRVSNMSGTVMLFESSLNIRNANDAGQSLIGPVRHSGHQQFVFVNIGGPAGKVLPSFALQIAPPSFYSTASADQLAEAQKRTQTRLLSAQSSFARVNQEFERELRQAVPQSNPPTLSLARNLEMSIGLQVMGLQNIKKLRSIPTRSHPSALSSDRHDAERWTEAKLRPLLLQEAQLLPDVPGPQLARLHSTSASMTDLQFQVWGLQSEVTQVNKEIQRRQRQKPAP